MPTRYSECPMLVVCDNDNGTYTDPCQVLLDGRKISVSYVEEGKPVTWHGEETDTGHYMLRNTAAEWGTLHRSPNSDILEGRWSVEGLKGFWEITLKNLETL